MMQQYIILTGEAIGNLAVTMESQAKYAKPEKKEQMLKALDWIESETLDILKLVHDGAGIIYDAKIDPFYTTSKWNYSTQRNGDSYHYEHYIFVKKQDQRDKDRENHPIFVYDPCDDTDHPLDELAFIVVARPGSPERFGQMTVSSPVI